MTKHRDLRSPTRGGDVRETPDGRDTPDSGVRVATENDAAAADMFQASEPAAEEAFVRGVLVRGEAAESVGGELPADATHEIVEDAGEHDGLPTIRRRRFSVS